MNLKPKSLIDRGSQGPPKTLADFLFQIGAHKNWDSVAFTSGFNQSGYAAVIVSRRDPDWEIAVGSMVGNSSYGHAHLRAVHEVASYLVNKKAGFKSGGYQCYVVTDSRYVSTGLRKVCRDPLESLRAKSNRLDWIGIQYAARMGIQLYPNYSLRDGNPLMSLASMLSHRASICLDGLCVDKLSTFLQGSDIASAAKNWASLN